MTTPAVLLAEQRDDGVLLLTLNRPEKRNALSIELRETLARALAAAAADDTARAIVVTGAGSAFCSGMDTTQFGGDRAHKERIVTTSVALFDAVARCPKPVVAAVNGPAIAGGFALALLCDLRVAADGARFGFPEVGRHIPPSYAAARAALAPAVARDLALTGRLVDADEALALNVASRRGDLDAAIAVAAGVAASPPAAIAEVKRRFLLGGETGWAGLLADEERALRAALLGEPGGA